MPFHRTARAKPEEQGALLARLIREFEVDKKGPSDDPEAPDIIAEPADGPIRRLFVVWDAWDRIDQRVRSELITDAYAHVFGLPDAANLTIAMGLSTEEAKRLGITVPGAKPVTP